MLSSSKGASVVVVGGGVTGLSAAWWLSRTGVDVLLLEKGMIGWGASGRNGGGCSHHFSPLFLEEQRLWPQMDDLLGYPTEFTPSRLRIALNEAQMKLYGQAHANGQRQGFKSDILTPQDVRELVPLAGDNMVGGYHYHFGGHANPHRTTQAYAWAMADCGGRIMQNCAVTGFRVTNGEVSGVETEQGFFACDKLVIAAGPQTGYLSKLLGCEVPMMAARAEMIVTEALPLMANTGVDGNGLYGRQTLRGNLAYGGGPHEWIDGATLKTLPNPSTPLMAHIGRRLAELFPRAAHARVIRSWSGIVENTPDGRPIIDALPSVRNAIVATLSSVGFGLSPATGRVIRDLVTDGACTFADISSFRLSRFDKLEPDWQELQGWHPRGNVDQIVS